MDGISLFLTPPPCPCALVSHERDALSVPTRLSSPCYSSRKSCKQVKHFHCTSQIVPHQASLFFFWKSQITEGTRKEPSAACHNNVRRHGARGRLNVLADQISVSGENANRQPPHVRTITIGGGVGFQFERIKVECISTLTEGFGRAHKWIR